MALRALLPLRRVALRSATDGSVSPGGCSQLPTSFPSTSRPRPETISLQRQSPPQLTLLTLPHLQYRSYRSFVRIRSPSGKGSARVPLTNSVYGHATSRGTRPYQEDTSSASCLEIPADQLRSSLQKGGKIATEAERRWHWPDEHEPLDEELAAQVNWWGVYDGHGGDYTSRYLAANLHQIFEKISPDMVTDTVQYTRQHGGYFRRFMGGALERWVRKEELKPVRGGKAGRKPGSEREQSKSKDEKVKSTEEGIASSPDDAQPDTGGAGEAERLQEGGQPTHAADSAPRVPRIAREDPNKNVPEWDDNGLTKRIAVPEGMEADSLTLSERATLAFLVADRHILVRHPQLPSATEGVQHEVRGIQTRDMEERASKEKEGGAEGGSTGSVLTLHSVDAPPVVWYDSQFLLLGAWHVGDTRMLLCPGDDGKAIPLTTLHHPDVASESDRLRRLGAGVVTDSFGEARWMGALANTRALGDGEFKAAGVTPEPEMLSQVIRSDRYSHVTMFSDGISSVMSDQEIVDLARGCAHPQEAAKKILDFAEQLGVEDNATVLVVPLKGWGKIGGTDSTLKQREYRKSKVDVFRDNRK